LVVLCFKIYDKLVLAMIVLIGHMTMYSLVTCLKNIVITKNSGKFMFAVMDIDIN
jgi:hypothetical protein